MNVVVVGAGKMGLPLACQLASQGASVVACDINPRIVETINAGRCPIDEPGVPEILATAVRGGRLRATTDTATAVTEATAIVVIVPAILTPDHDIDFAMLEAASRQIARGLQHGALVCYETTMPVGGTRRTLLPILEESGLQAGTNLDVVFSPERVKSRYVLRNLTKNPKVVGGITPSAAARAADFYGKYLGAPVLNVGTLEAAEMVKLAGMLYRDVNIALANELARYAEIVGVNLPELIAVINTDGEASLLSPGVGVGGHCTPVYPHFLIRDAARLGVRMTLAEEGRRLNDDQPRHLVERLEQVAGSLAGARVLVLGLAFRPDVKEHRLSPAFQLRTVLERRGANVLLHDPLYSADEIADHGFRPAELADVRADAVILNTAHAAYSDFPFEALARRGLRAVADGRHFWSAEVVEGFGVRYVAVGRPVAGRSGALNDVPLL